MTPAPAAEPAVEKKPVVKADPVSATDTDDILSKVANSDLIKPNIKSILEKSCIIEHGEDKSVMYVFNKLQG